MKPSARPLFVRTFMTHDMKDEDIIALSTGRDEELRRILNAIRRSRRAAPGPLQHVVLYGARGFGKSFMMRRVEIEVAGLDDQLGAVRFVLLPEEQHNLQRSPHAFLDAIALKLKDLQSGSDAAFAGAMFQWPRPEEEARRWNEAAARLEKAVDASLPEGKGLVIVAVENFDALLASLFKEETDEQRLRQWLDRRKNRLMLVGSATGTVDLDYERPLFKAFEPVRLSPWTPDDCIAYFNRLRAREGRAELDSEQEAKAKAIAEFVGGTPRLAQLLAEVIDTQDALTVAETMNALADRVAEYYRRRIEDLPPLGRGLLDALIRGGEPASQTELAARVKADGQNVIARAMDDLQRADILRGRPAKDSRETLYAVTDRVFAHYYRLRQGSRAAAETPLATILDFLKSFYSREEQRAQSLRYLEAGRPAEAALFSRLALEGEKRREVDYMQSFARRLDDYLDGAADFSGTSAKKIIALLENEPAEAFELCQGLNCEIALAKTIATAIKAQALFRMGLLEPARMQLESGVDCAGDNSDAKVAAICELWLFTDEPAAAAHVGLRLQVVAPEGLRSHLAWRRFFILWWSLDEVGRRDEAVSAARDAADLARFAGDRGKEAMSLRGLAFSLGDLGRHEEAVNAAHCAAEAARLVDDKGEEATSLRLMAFSLGRLERYDEAVDAAQRAAEAARLADEREEEATSLRLMAFSLRQLERYDEAVDVAQRVAELARQADDKSEEAVSLRLMAFSLSQLERYGEAVTAAKRAAELAKQTDDKNEEAVSLRLMAVSLGQLERYDEAVTAAKRAAELARQTGDKSEEAMSLRRMAFSLAQLSRHEEAMDAARSAAELARLVGDKSEEAVALQYMAFSLNALGRGDDAWSVARISVTLAQEIGDAFSLTWAAAQAIKAATQTPRSEAVAFYGEWLEAWRAVGASENLPNPLLWLDDLMIAAAHARAFAQLDAVLAKHRDWLARDLASFGFTPEHGDALARIADSEGRACAFDAFAGLLPRLSVFLAQRPEGDRNDAWLSDLMSGFARACRDPGLLRDVATLLTAEISPRAPESASLLRVLADVDDAHDAETALARMDPDTATLIRRLRDLPDPPPILQKRKIKRRRKPVN